MNIFRLSEPNHGWIDVTFGEPPDALTLSASDVPNDCLRDLAWSIVRLTNGSAQEAVEFSLEPEFAICELHRNQNSIRTIIRIPAHAAPAFDATFSLRTFAREVRAELLRIRPYYSTKDGWTQPFPEDDVAKLE